MKKVKVSKKARPHRKGFMPAQTKGKQTRKTKGGSGTSLMHAAAKKMGRAAAAKANMSPVEPKVGEPSTNRADKALYDLTKGNEGDE